ncbi:uncharacterized protein LOC116248272 isoform X2 [Nymphaea colorata]|uniref:uncharacterized protein LOC116248272 isoform X2 n=1 Tax=Nymphaea colorata TaxID=210225 RepID=UPI00129DA359|nr:uncharacterized protein LOC116248272 isoform X2 [Nymphaea colorata]
MDGSSLHHQTQRHMRPMEQHPPPPPPPQGPWNSPQFQYHPSHPPPPPPYHHYLHHQQQQLPQPPQPQWVPPPDHPQMQFAHPHPPPPPPGPSHYGIGSYPPPPHHYPPPPSRPLPHPQVTQMYGQPDQPWSNSSWPQNQYPDHNISHYNEQDWAARARAWAAAKAAMETQQTFSSVGRKEEQSPGYHEYQHTVGPHGSDTQQSPVPALSHQSFPASLTDHSRSSSQYQLATSFGPEPLTYPHDGHPSYTAKDGTFAADAKLLSAAPEGSILSSSSVYQQELPSSYSSVPGNNEAGHGSGSHQSSSLPPVSSGGELYSQPVPPVAAVLSSIQSPSYIYGNESAMPVKDVSDQPLDYEHPSAFHKHEHQHQHQISYGHSAPSGLVGGSDQISPAASIHSWTSPVAAGVAFPTVPPVPPGPQLENSFVPHALPVHPVPVLGGVSGPNFRPTIPPMNSPFGVSPGTPLQMAAAFPAEVNGTFSISERPKKASVPSWLREEIMKKKAAVISSSVQDQSFDLPAHSSDADGAEKVFRKVDQEDSKSIDSAKSTEDDNDEDDVEAERSAVLNQEIKRILTEVLLKVTDELFDEIATKVMEEDDLVVEVPVSNKLPSSTPPTPASSTPKSSARVLAPVKHNNSNEAEADKKSSSGSPGGNVLGLANYASDDDEVDSSGPSNMQNNGVANGEGFVKAESEDSLDKCGVSNGRLSTSDTQCNAAIAKTVSRGTSGDKSVDDTPRVSSGFSSSTLKSENENVPTFVDHSGTRGGQFDAANKGKTDEVAVSSSLHKAKSDGQSCTSPVVREKSSTDELADKIGRKKLSGGEHDSRKGSNVSRHDRRELETDKSKRGQHESSSSNVGKAQENRNIHKEKPEERNKVDKLKDTGAKLVGKSLDSDGGKSFKHINSKDDDKLVNKSRGANVKVDSTRKRERPTEEKEDRSRHREKKDSHKKHHSSSNPSRARGSRVDSSSSDRSGASYDSSDDARRTRTRKRSSSPARSRSRKRQVSRSPNSRHSQRKHSPYSSHDTRNRNSRSVSPVRRHR